MLRLTIVDTATKEVKCDEEAEAIIGGAAKKVGDDYAVLSFSHGETSPFTCAAAILAAEEVIKARTEEDKTIAMSRAVLELTNDE